MRRHGRLLGAQGDLRLPGLGLWGLWDGVARHSLRSVLVLGGIGAVLMVVGIFLQPLLYVGAAVMIGASIWNALALRWQRQGRLEW